VEIINKYLQIKSEKKEKKWWKKKNLTTQLQNIKQHFPETDFLCKKFEMTEKQIVRRIFKKNKKKQQLGTPLDDLLHTHISGVLKHLTRTTEWCQLVLIWFWSMAIDVFVI